MERFEIPTYQFPIAAGQAGLHARAYMQGKRHEKSSLQPSSKAQ